MEDNFADSTELNCPSGLHNSNEEECAKRLQQRSNFVSVLESMRVTNHCFYVPLRRMITLPRVQPIQEVDVKTLEKRFEGGYIDGDRAFLISLFDDKESTMEVTEDRIATWDAHWKEVNDRFEEQLLSDPQYASFSGKMFFIWDGNHRHFAWWRHTNKEHSEDLDWHYSVFSIVVNPSGRILSLLNYMHDVNW
jgi:hypothetical protein